MERELVEQEGAHARRQHNLSRSTKRGVLLLKRNGTQSFYLKYSALFAVQHIREKSGREQIDCRAGDSSFTIVGRNLWPLFEDLQAEQCELVRESDPRQMTMPIIPYVETITARLWL